jgi:hypothetical protein
VDGETRSDAEIARQRAEEVPRKAADIAWLNEGFAYAKSVHAAGVMIIFQADLNFNNEQHRVPRPGGHVRATDRRRQRRPLSSASAAAGCDHAPGGGRRRA